MIKGIKKVYEKQGTYGYSKIDYNVAQLEGNDFLENVREKLNRIPSVLFKHDYRVYDKDDRTYFIIRIIDSEDENIQYAFVQFDYDNVERTFHLLCESFINY